MSGITGVVPGECPQCGRLFLMVQPGQVTDQLKEDSLSTVDVIVLGSDRDRAQCSQCGNRIELPAVEELDLDRSPMGRSFEKMLDDIMQEHGETRP